MRSEIREPIHKKWIWLVLVVLVVFNAPWFLPEGSIEPFLFGVPYWVIMVLILSVMLSAFIHWVCMTQWNILEDEEEADRRG